MIDHSVYKVLHLIGVLMVFSALGGTMVHALNGGTKETNEWRKVLGITHGIGLVLLLVAGFGMMARLGIHWPWPGWVFTKFAIWLVLGGVTVAIHKLGNAGQMLWPGILVLGSTAAYLAVVKPF